MPPTSRAAVLARPTVTTRSRVRATSSTGTSSSPSRSIRTALANTTTRRSRRSTSRAPSFARCAGRSSARCITPAPSTSRSSSSRRSRGSSRPHARRGRRSTPASWPARATDAMLGTIRVIFAFLGSISPALAGRFAARLFCRPRHPRRPDRERALIASGTPVPLPNGLSATGWGAGPVVLLVHGWEGRGAQLGAFVDPLVAAGYRVIAFDGPAHGDSTGTTVTGPEFAQALQTARDAVGPLAAVVAHSFGAFTTLLAASQRLAADRIVVIGAPSSVPEVLREFQELIALPPRAMPHMVHALEQR